MSKPADIDPVIAAQLGQAHPYVPGQPGRPSLAKLAAEKRAAEKRAAAAATAPINIHETDDELQQRWINGEFDK